MKIIKYSHCTKINHGTDKNPQIEEILSHVTMGWNEINEEIAKQESYNGEYTVEDDGTPESVVEPTTEQRITELEEALELLLSGVTE